MRKKIIQKQKDLWYQKTYRARKKYLNNKHKGDYSIVVDEWDEFELERERQQLKEKEGEGKMRNRRVLVRLSKAYNNVEVEVDGIETIQDFEQEKKWAKDEAMLLINQLPNEQLGSNQRKETPKQYTNRVQPKTPTSPSIPQSNYTKQDITTQFLKGKQVDHALKLLNNGKVSLETVNSLVDWQDSQGKIYTAENKKFLFGK